MLFPTIPEYKEALLNRKDSFNTHADLEPVLDGFGDVYRVAGGFAVVFKMRDKNTKKLYALKCFHKKKNNLIESYSLISSHLKTYNTPYLVNYKFLEKEIWVSTEVTEQSEFPVVLMDWVDGKTLREELKIAVAKNDQALLQHLSVQFDEMALWLLDQPFAHTDLKPENILVTPGKQFVLVDYDGLFVPGMQGQEAREEGTVGFKHPYRGSKNFDRHTDDFSILLISLALRLIAREPKLYTETNSDEHLLFKEADLQDYKNSKLLERILLQAKNDNGSITMLVSIMQLALNMQDGQIILLPKSIKSTMCLGKTVKKVSKYSFSLLNTFADFQNKCGTIHFTADGKQLVRGGDGGKLDFFKLPGFQHEYTMTDYASSIWSISTSHDGQFMAFGGASDTLKVHVRKQNTLSHPLNNHSNYARCTAISPNGKYLVSGSFDRTVNVYSLPQLSLAKKLRDHSDYILGIKFSRDGKWLASCGRDKTIRLYDAATFHLVHTFQEKMMISSIDFSADGEYLACGGFDGVANLYRLNTKMRVCTFKDGIDGSVKVVFNPVNQLLAVAGEFTTVNIYNVDDQELVHQMRYNNGKICAMDFSPDGQFFACCGYSGPIQAYRVTGEVILQQSPGASIDNDLAPAGIEVLNTPGLRLQWWNSLQEQWKMAFRKTLFMRKLKVPTDHQLCIILNLEELYIRCGAANYADMTDHVDNLEGIRHLTKLKQLWCWGNKISSLEPIKHLKNLQEIYCSNNLLRDLGPLSKLTELKTLVCSHNHINNVKPLSNLMKLEKLNCANNKIIDFTPLKGIMNNLYELNCLNNPSPEKIIEEYNIQRTNPAKKVRPWYIRPDKKIGRLKLGDPVLSRVKILGDNYTVQNHITGAIEYRYQNLGISMLIKKDDPEQKIISVHVYPPFQGKTLAGIGLSTKKLQDVLDTYGEPRYSTWIGANLWEAMYDGIVFCFEKDKSLPENRFDERLHLNKPIIEIRVLDNFGYDYDDI
jgi:WD40 repeat protein